MLQAACCGPAFAYGYGAARQFAVRGEGWCEKVDDSHAIVEDAQARLGF